MYFASMAEGNAYLQHKVLNKNIASGEIDALAFSVINSKYSAKLFNQSKIPFITIDAGFAAEDIKEYSIKRHTYIGTDNYQLGYKLGAEYVKNFKDDADICILSGSRKSESLNLRIRGFKDSLKENKFKNHYHPRCPMHSQENVDASLAQMNLVMVNAKREKRKLVVASMGGWAQLNYTTYSQRMEKFRKDIASENMKILFVDSLPTQIRLLNEGLSSLNVGQKPELMGRLAVRALVDLLNKKEVKPKIYTPSRVCYRGTCSSKN